MADVNKTSIATNAAATAATINSPLQELDNAIGTNVYNKTATPTVNDDSANTSGNGVFAVKSRWIDTTNDRAYVCVDATPTAAVWKSASFVTNTPVQIDTHIAATSAIHGLPAGAYALGNKNAAGEFVQSGTINSTGAPSSFTSFYKNIGDVTFPVAFSVAPIVVFGCKGVGSSHTAFGCGATEVSTTQIIGIYALAESNISLKYTVYWMAIGI